MEEIDPHKCIARMWNKGCGGQCSQKRKFGDFCKKHKGGNSWCGILTEPRPRNPVNSKGKIHTWKCDKIKHQPLYKQEPIIKEEPVNEEVVEEEVLEEEVVLEEPVQEEVVEVVEVVDEEVVEEEVVEEEVVEVVEEDDTDDVVLQGELIVFKGKEYYLVIKTSKILDIHSLDEIGEWDPDNERIQFF